MTAIIRKATEQDLDAVADLFDQYRRFYGMPADLSRARAFIGERMQRGDSHLLVAELGDGRLGGFVQLYPGFSSVAAAPVLILNDLFVAPDCRRLGLGRQLMEAAQQTGRETGAVYLTLSTAVDNHAAQALYESLGWVRDREFFHYEWTTGVAP